MTDTTDTTALRERLVSLNRTYGLISSPATMEQANTSAHMFVKAGGIHHILAALDQLEAERQRADLATRQNEGINNNLRRRAVRAEAELAALKGDQVPVAEIKFHPSTDKHPCMYWFGKQDRDFPVGTQFFTSPQKPVVLPGISELIDACDSTPAVRDVDVWDLAISEVKRLNPSLFSDKSAAGGIVKDGE